MKLNVDKEADALYLRLDDTSIFESEEVSPGVALEYNESNEVVGVEMLHLSKRPSSLNLSARNCSGLRGKEELAAFEERIEAPCPPCSKDGCQGHLALRAPS